MSTTGSADSEGVHECEHRDEAVTAILSANFRSDLTSRYDLEFKNGIDMQDAAHCTYLKQSLDDMCNRLLDSLDRTEAALAKEPDPLNDEIKLHLAFAKLRAERFSPTGSSSAALDRAKVFTRQAGGRACVVHGPSGAGKTYVVAKLAVDLSSESKTCVVRFLGTSGDTADVGSLLRSVCQQLRAISMGKEAFVSDAAVSSKALPPCPSAYDDLVKYFFDSIKRWSWGPVVIILESLDQLSDVLGGRLLNWLLVDGFSGEVHIVCSTLPDEPNPKVGRPFRCLSILKKRIQDEQLFIEVAALKDSALLIAHLLKLKCRRVTEGQLAALVETMERAQTPLMATLITDKASQWKSNEAAPEELPSSVRGIILEFFRDLVSYFQKLEKSKQAGERLVKHALSYITLVSKGIADTELQEILSLDDDVLADSHRWWFTPDRKLPSAPLQLLLRLLAPYLSRRGQAIGGDLSVWYHRQLWEAAEAYYLENEEFRAALHRILSEFFGGRFSGRCKPCSQSLRVRLGLSDSEAENGVDRHVRKQPFVLKGASAFHAGATVNERRCTEAMLHMVKELVLLNKIKGLEGIPQRIKEISKMAEGELCSSEAVCARGIAGETFNLVRQSATLMQLASTEDIDMTSVDHFNRWIRRDAHEFSCGSSVALSALRQPETSKARKQHIDSRDHVPGVPWLVLGGSLDFDAVVSVLKGHNGEVLCTDWHSKGLVSGDDSGGIIIWDADTGEKSLELKGHAGSVKSVRWSRAGDWVAFGSEDGTVIVWDAATGDKVKELSGHASSVASLAWCPNDSQVASGSTDNTVIIWDAATGDKVSELKGHSSSVYSVAWSPNSSQVASGSADNTVIIWDAATGNKVSELKGHSNWVTSVAWSPKGTNTLASGSYDKTVIIWDVATGEQKAQLKGHTDYVRSVAWGPGNVLASGSDDKTIIIWDVISGEQKAQLNGHTNYVMSVAWGPEGTLASGSYDKTVIVWDVGRQEQKACLKGHTGEVCSVAWGPGGCLASGSDDKTVIVWDLERGEQKVQLIGHTGSVLSVAWGPRGDKIASGSSDKTVLVWDAATGEKALQLEGHSGGVMSVAWSPTGDELASGSEDRTAIVWDAASGEKVFELKGHNEPVRSVEWSQDGTQILTAGDDMSRRVWDAASGAQVSTLEGTRGASRSPSGKRVAAGSSDHAVTVLDAVTGEQVSQRRGANYTHFVY